MKPTVIVPQKNNMDFLRLLFALTVVFYHISVLSQNSSFTKIPQFASGLLAVRCFFIVSGFLIFMSYENSSSLRFYFEKRIRRVYPAYFVVVLSAALLGMLVTRLPLVDYLGHGFIRYLLCNLVFVNFAAPTLPGVFSDNWSNAVNGALWTIKVEVSFYIFVPLLAWCMTKWPRKRVLTLFYMLSLIWSFILNHFANLTGQPIYADLAKELPGQLSYFLSGAAIYYYFELFQRNLWNCLLLGIALWVFSDVSSFSIFLPAGLALCVIAASFGKYFGNVGKYGDFSFGVYIFHFPIIQTFVSFGLFDRHPWIALGAALATCLLVSFLCWHLVERPFLKKSSHYRLAESGSPLRVN
jgi:peptidoglycan/LPS O-acetylase OafA/YrhL